MDNIRGSALMVLAMAGFALEDTFIKFVSADLPVGQILFMMGIGGAVIFGAISVLKGDRFVSRDFLVTPVLLRNLGEMIAAFGYITALTLIPLSTVAAIIQATPLCVTLGAALFMGEQVGWRRWSAIVVGFFGVLLIIRPGLEGFQPASLFAVIGVAGLALRDLSTRVVPPSVSSMQLSGYAFATVILIGLALLVIDGGAVQPSATNWLQLGAMIFFSVVGYYAIVAAMRIGDVSAVTPFRYSRLVFSLILGIAIFGEQPDWLTYTGAALIIGSGLYSILRERRLARVVA
ncbi:DMT family transporter [Roseovarius sp. CAU 1744]|uniref:DMT family transporter n=1 Tax=Roseovarius sp. CAU 1744 TaxID=3140368 RepID=UPI00325B186D